MPVYSCKIEGTEDVRIVRARSAAQARAHLVDAEPLSAEELADAINNGSTLETATAPAEEAPAEEESKDEPPQPTAEKEPKK